jgi:PAS domain S-box-containing protein
MLGSTSISSIIAAGSLRLVPCASSWRIRSWRIRLEGCELQILNQAKFGSVLREGADGTNPNPVAEFIADVVGLWLLSLNALLCLVLLPWSRGRAKDKPERELQEPTKPIRVLLDSDFRYVEMDPEFCELLGLPKSELIGKDAEYVTPTDFCNIREFREQVRQLGEKDGFWLYRRGDGSLVLVHYSIAVRHDNMADLLVTPAARRAVREDTVSSEYKRQSVARDCDVATKK